MKPKITNGVAQASTGISRTFFIFFFFIEAQNIPWWSGRRRDSRRAPTLGTEIRPRRRAPSAVHDRGPFIPTALRESAPFDVPVSQTPQAPPAAPIPDRSVPE